MKQIISILLLSLLLFSCVQSNNENGLGGYIDEETYQNEFMTDNDEPLILEMEFDSITIDTSFIDFTNNIIAYLKNDNLIQFATTFHPKKGCKFIPYPYLVEEDLVFNVGSNEQNSTLLSLAELIQKNIPDSEIIIEGAGEDAERL